MLIEKDYCDYDTQKSLMNIGFPMKAQSYDLGNGVKEYLPKIHFYDAQKWLREERGINIFVMQIIIEGSNTHRYASYIQLGDKIWLCRYYSLYEEALLEGIKEAVKILKEIGNGV